MITVPHRLPQRVRKAQGQNVANGLFAQEVIHAQDLVLVENLVQLVVECQRRREVVAKRFLNHDRGPANEVRLTEGDDDRRKQRGWRFQIEQRSRTRCEFLLQPFVCGAGCEVALHVVESSSQAVKGGFFDVFSVALQRRSRMRAQLVERPFFDGHANNRKIQQTVEF